MICNLVLMLTPNPKKVLSSIYNTTTEDALMGITIVGDKEKSDFYNLFANSVKSAGLELPTGCNPFDYQNKI